MHKSYTQLWVSIEPEIKYEGFGGGPLLVGAWGPGPLPPPLKSGPGTELGPKKTQKPICHATLAT